jgi:hypothetical protein
MSIFEIVMLICFGAAWPFSIWKSFRSGTTRGKSLPFLLIVMLGYLAGILHKVFYSPDRVVLLYSLNLLMVATDTLLFIRNKREIPMSEGTPTPEKLPVWKMIIFSLGQFGWNLSGFAAGTLLVYFYMPPETGTPLFPAYIYTGSVLGAFTIIGLIFASSRIFAGITDPWLANLSDRSTSRFGKRRTYMALGAVPTALFPFLIYIPPVQGTSWLNALWLFVTIFMFTLGITAYTMPYNALISEFGHNPRERLVLSSLTSLTWALSFAVANQVYELHSMLMRADMIRSGH